MTMTTKNGQNKLIAARQTPETLATVLETEVGSHVADKTGLTGTYDFTLEPLRFRNKSASGWSKPDPLITNN